MTHNIIQRIAAWQYVSEDSRFAQTLTVKEAERRYGGSLYGRGLGRPKGLKPIFED